MSPTNPNIDKQTLLREVILPSIGAVWACPNVSRVENKKWHGWQVRWSGFHAFISDADHGGPEHSLRVANLFRMKNYPGRKLTFADTPSVQKRVVKERGKNSVYLYLSSLKLEAHQGKLRNLSVYVGRENETDTEARYLSAYAEIMRQRSDQIIQRTKEHRMAQEKAMETLWHELKTFSGIAKQ